MATADGHLLFDTKLDADGLKKGLDALGGVASTAMKGVTVAVGAVGSALSAMGGYAIKVGSDFEAAMSQVKAISGANAEEFDALKEKAKEMGATTKFSATESAEALNYMAMAGWKTQQMLDGLPGIMNLAAASGEELGTVSDIVTDALTAFGLKAEESGRFADVLAQASASSNTNVSMMGATFKYVAPVAGALGYSVEDVAVAVGLMANASIKGEQAGTSLRGALTRLVKPTKEVNAALENLGMVSKTYGNVINEKDVAKAEKQITSASKSIISAQESVEKKTISVQKAQAAYNQALEKYGADSTQAQQKALSLQNAQNNLASAQDKLSAAQGKLTDSQNALSSAQSGNMEVTSSSVNLLTDQAGNMRPLIDVIKDLREAFKGLSQEEQAQTAASLFGQEAMSGMLAIINASDEDFQKLSKSISESEGATDRFATIMQDNLKGQLDNLSSAVEGLGIEFYESIDNPLKEIAKNATGYVNQLSKAFKDGGVNGLVSEIGTVFSDIAIKLAESAPTVIQVGTDTILSFISGIKNSIPALSDALLSIGESVLSAFLDIIPELLITGGELLLSLAKGITERIPDLIPKVKEVALSLIEAFSNNAPELLRTGFELLLELAKGFAEAYPEMIPAAVDAILFLIEGLIENIPLLLDAALQLVIGLAEGLIKALPLLIEKGPEIIQKLAIAIVESIPVILKAIVQLVESLVEAFLSNPNWDKVIDGVQSIWDSIASFFTETVPQFFTDLWDTVAQAWSDGWDAIISFFTETIPVWLNSVFKFFEKLPEKIGEIIGKVFGLFTKLGVDLIAWVKNDIPQIISSIIVFFTKLPGQIWEWLKETLNKIIFWGIEVRTQAEETGKNFLNSFFSFVESLPQKMNELFIYTINQVRNWGIDLINTASTEIPKFADKVVEILSLLPQKINEIGVNIIKSLWGGIQSMGNWLDDQISSFVDGFLNGFNDLFSSKSSSKRSSGRSSVYEYAKGTSYHPGGLAIVGENGPELLNLPRGSQVLSNHRLNNLQNQIQGDLSQFSLQLQAAVDSQMHSNTAGIVARSAYSAPRQPVYPMQAPQLTLNYYSSGGTADDAKIIGRRMQREYTNELRSKGVVIL